MKLRVHVYCYSWGREKIILLTERVYEEHMVWMGAFDVNVKELRLLPHDVFKTKLIITRLEAKKYKLKKLQEQLVELNDEIKNLEGIEHVERSS